MKDASAPQSTTAAEAPQQKADAVIDLTGQTLGDFQIRRCLGEGGMGQVYLAEQVSLKRKVALKLLRADLAANATALARFKQEAEAVARATHANIVQVYAIGEVNGLHFMALEYVEGRNLRQFLEKKGPPEVMLALSIMRQVAAALQRASELGIIHRDIKPENILLTRKGEVKVADFGLSRIFGDDKQPLHLTQSGITMGTPLYMSPEQVEGKPVDPRTDIYSFGVTCYYLLAGQPPFRGQSAFEVAIQHVQNQAVPLAQIRPDLPPELCQLIHRMMAKKPEDRIQTGREIAREVVRLRDSLVGVASTQSSASGVIPAAAANPTHLIQMGPGLSEPMLDASLTQALPRTLPYNGLLWLAVLSILVGLGTGLGYGWWRNHDQPAPRPVVPTNVNPELRPELPFKAAADPSKDEQLLLQMIKREIDKGEGPALVKHRVELGVIYLQERRLDEADKLFQIMITEAVPDKTKQLGSRGMGKLGQAIVLAFRDQAQDSNKIFVAVLAAKVPKFKEPLSVPLLLQRNAAFSELVAKALDHNYANAPASFPGALQVYRAPPAPRVRAPEKTLN
jgi:serine/threonine-protein kinase